MKIRRIFPVIFMICLLFLTGKGWAEEKILTAPVPDWVAQVVIPKADKIPSDKVQNGVFYLLVDSQIRVDDKREFDHYFRMAEFIVNPEGVDQSSQINIDYDPGYQKLVLHSLNVIRKGEVINRLNSARMEFIQREEELGELIYNGKITLNILLADIRVGDIVEYSYSSEGMNPVYQGVFAYSSSLNWSVPLQSHFLRILWGKSTPLQYSIVNSSLEVKQRELGASREYLIQENNIEPIKPNDRIPSWYNPWGSVYFSELDSWTEVATWGRGLYRDVVKVDGEIGKLVADIKQNYKGKKAQISAALQFVQDDIRYLGIELGENSHKPRATTETLRNRYGDCKDKTVLFLSLLKGLGVLGYPALVNTESKLKDTVPGVRSFNHVISYFEYDEEVYWVDPTRNYQHGNLDSIHQPDYGKALVLRPEVEGLTPMRPNTSKYGVLVKDHFSVPASGPVTFTSETINYGWNAERQRRRLASNGQDKIQIEYLDFFKGYFPGIEIQAPIVFLDDSVSNIFTYTERYTIKDFWLDKVDSERYEIDFYANVISSSVSVPDAQDRLHPMELLHPEHVEQVVEVSFEEDGWAFESEQFEEDNDRFTFKKTVSFDRRKRKLRLEYSYHSKADHITAEDFALHIAALKRVKDQLGYGIYKRYSNYSGVAGNEDSLLSKITVLSVIYLYAVLYALLIFLWRFDRWRNPDKGESLYFPVSLGKLAAMWVGSFGFYGLYWFYRNFKYIKHQENSAIMPVARGLFYGFWYFSLWHKLNEDNAQRFDVSHLPNKSLAGILALLFFISVILSRIADHPLVFFFLSILAILPLANYVLFINGSKSAATVKNSKWQFRHVLLILLSLPLYAVSIGSETGLLPSDSVVEGHEISDRDIKFMQRNGLLRPGDTLGYFYSDALLFVRDDGNGFTQRHVFSYWKENGSLEKKEASFNSIEDIQVGWATSTSENTTVTIVGKDGSEFILYVSNIEGKDKVFVATLKKHWESAQ